MAKGAASQGGCAVHARPRARGVGQGGDEACLAGLQSAIAADYQAGAGIRLLARRFGVSDKAVRRAVIASGGAVRDGGRPRHDLPPDLAAEFVREYERLGLTAAEIGARHHTSPARVRAALAGAGVDLRRYALNADMPLSEADRAAIASAYAAGTTFRGLMRRYRCGSARVRAAIVEHGVEVRPSADGSSCGRTPGAVPGAELSPS